jgi:hypothetical protein
MTKKEIVHLKGGKIIPLVKKKKKDPTPKGVMRYASKILNKLAPQWTSRQDLQKLTTEVSQVCELEDKRSYTKTFVKIIEVLNILIPLWKDKKELSTLRDSIRKINEKTQATTQDTIAAQLQQFVPKSQLSLTTSDIDHWVRTSKKNDQLVYYTGTTFSTTRTLKERQVFKRARDICLIFHEVANKKIKYDYRGTRGDWGSKYKNIVSLAQKKVAPQQKNSDGTIISYPIYNYTMIKL